MKKNVNNISIITKEIFEALMFDLALSVIVETASAGRQTHDVIVVQCSSEETAYVVSRKVANRFRQWIYDGQWKHHDHAEGGVMGWYCRTDTYTFR